MSTLNFFIWSIWRQLPYLLRFFFLVQTLVTIYVLLSAAIVLVRLKLLSNRGRIQNALSYKQSLAALEVRCANIRQLITATFYLFWFIFFLVLPYATRILGDTHIPIGTLILRNFVTYLAFAANVIFILLVLHMIQWFVSGRVHSFALRLNPQNIS
jgi:hypothetical protein